MRQTPRENDGPDDRHHQKDADDLDGEQVFRVHRLSDRQGLSRGHSLIRRRLRSTADGVKDEQRLCEQHYSKAAAYSVKELQPIRPVLVLEIEEHDHEDHQDHDRSRVDQYLHGGDERCRERYIYARQSDENAHERDRTVERILVIDHRDRTHDREARE